mmetsp:Transcript_29444/g.41186  ORF Transcript_29444/g.41186 Transcript_29444/m.41186 type:complete len:215 (+) Transcript_29444:1398-2042(+)
MSGTLPCRNPGPCAAARQLTAPTPYSPSIDGVAGPRRPPDVPHSRRTPRTLPFLFFSSANRIVCARKTLPSRPPLATTLEPKDAKEVMGVRLRYLASSPPFLELLPTSEVSVSSSSTPSRRLYFADAPPRLLVLLDSFCIVVDGRIFVAAGWDQPISNHSIFPLLSSIIPTPNVCIPSNFDFPPAVIKSRFPAPEAPSSTSRRTLRRRASIKRE